MDQYLVLTALGRNRPGILSKITQLITECGCNIEDSRLAIFGSEFTLLMMLSGSHNSIARVEVSLPLLGAEHDLLTMIKRTIGQQQEKNIRRWAEISASGPDKPGLIDNFTRFFAQRDLNISSLSARSEPEGTGAVQLQLQMTVELSDDVDESTLGADLAKMCESISVSSHFHIVS
ncbi:glycine cleavage system transcriptional repressor [Parasalinivibrio latis]|uniref:glycine cleavage system protein R n=1 Tax=Parasalinivibrio latis TaxID=2952610 RepID=UPI0030E203AB